MLLIACSPMAEADTLRLYLKDFIYIADSKYLSLKIFSTQVCYHPNNSKPFIEYDVGCDAPMSFLIVNM